MLMLKLTTYRCFNPVIGFRRFTYKYGSNNSIETDEFYENDIFTNVPAYIGSNLSDIKYYKQVMAELEMYCKSGELAKQLINKNRWKDLLKALDINQRKPMYKHWIIISTLRQSVKKRKYSDEIKEEKKSIPSLVNSSLTNVLPPYEANGNCIIRRFKRKGYDTIRTFFEYKLILKMIFGPHLIIDCSYDSYMDINEVNDCFRQLKLLWTDNFYSRTPFNIMFCNMVHDSHLLQKLNTHYSGYITKPDSIFEYTEKSYLDFFKREELIYLSPHSDITLDRYDCNYTYIVGAFVDLKLPNELSKEKAAKDGIKTAKLPIFDHVHINDRCDLLPINQVVDILRQVKDGTPWSEAMICISNKKWTINPLTIKSESKDKMYATKNIKKFYKQKEILNACT